jgi:hypothetical protein
VNLCDYFIFPKMESLGKSIGEEWKYLERDRSNWSARKKSNTMVGVQIEGCTMGKTRWKPHLHAALVQAMTYFDDEEWKSSMDFVAQEQILKIQRFYREIDCVWDSNDSLKEAVADLQNIKDTVTKMVKGSYRGLPSFFYTVTREIEDTNWKIFLTERILLLHLCHDQLSSEYGHSVLVSSGTLDTSGPARFPNGKAETACYSKPQVRRVFKTHKMLLGLVEHKWRGTQVSHRFPLNVLSSREGG